MLQNIWIEIDTDYIIMLIQSKIVIGAAAFPSVMAAGGAGIHSTLPKTLFPGASGQTFTEDYWSKVVSNEFVKLRLTVDE